MIRDRKMYVVRTPYHIADGLAGERTLIVPSGWNLSPDFEQVGVIERTESEEVAIGYQFDLKKSDLEVISEPNPNAGKVHTFAAYRPVGGSSTPVSGSSATTTRRRRRA